MTTEPSANWIVAMRAAHEELPIPIMTYDATGLTHSVNRAAAEFWQIDRTTFIDRFNVYTDPATDHELTRATFTRVLQGEVFERTPRPDIRGRGTPNAHEIWYQPLAFPVRNPEGQIALVGYIYRDMTDHVRRQAELDRSHAELLVQQQLIRELGSPVVQVWEGIVLAPVVGVLDAQRAAAITENLLTAIIQREADVAIIDITGVPLIDHVVSGYLLNTAYAAQLLGAVVVLVGIRAEVAQSLVQIGADLRQIATLADLQAGLAWALAQRGLRVASSG